MRNRTSILRAASSIPARPGWSQIGTTWLPLPHLLMIPLVRNDGCGKPDWRAASRPRICMTLAATFLFAAVRRVFRSALAGSRRCRRLPAESQHALSGLYPDDRAGLLRGSVRAAVFHGRASRETQGWGALVGAAFAALRGHAHPLRSLVSAAFRRRLIILIARRAPLAGRRICFLRRRRRRAGALAGAQPLVLRRSAVFLSRPLVGARDSGQTRLTPAKATGTWRSHYFFEAGQLVAGLARAASRARRVSLVALAGTPSGRCCCWRCRPLFYIWSIHSSARRSSCPTSEPHGLYNTRYAMALLPLVALGAAAHRALRQDRRAAAVARCRSSLPASTRRALASPGRKPTSTRADAANGPRRRSLSCAPPPAPTRPSSPATATDGHLSHARHSAARYADRRQ